MPDSNYTSINKSKILTLIFESFFLVVVSSEMFLRTRTVLYARTVHYVLYVQCQCCVTKLAKAGEAVS